MNSSGKVTSSSKSNFVPAFFFLEKKKREALSALYAFCRLTDDIVDMVSEESDNSLAEKKLTLWRQSTEHSFENKSAHPVLLEFSQAVKNYKIPQKHVFRLIDGVQMDLEKKRYKNFEELYPYCYGVASTVGLMCLNIFGAEGVQAENYAVHLGVAFQLTNILRDVKTDGQRGRIYIPLEDLEKFGFTDQEWLRVVLDVKSASQKELSGFKDLIEFEGARAEDFYRKAMEGLTFKDRSKLLPAFLMTSIYYSILNKILKNPLRVLHSKVELSKLEILCRLLSSWIKNR